MAAGKTTYQYILKMKDKMSGTLKKAGAQGGKTYGKMQKLQGNLNKVTGKFGPIAQTAFGVIGVAAVSKMTKSLVTNTIKMAEMGDEAAKSARRLGITAEELQKLRFAADRQGVSNSVLESSFSALQKRVGELRIGSGGLYTYLNKTGNNVLKSQLENATNAGEAFDLIVDAMGNLKDPMDRAALANAAFSRAGLDMIKLMEIGGEGIQDLKDQATELGFVMTNEAAAKSEKFVDVMTNFKATMKGLRITLASRLMPILQEFIEKMQQWIQSNKDLMAQKLEGFFEKVAKTAQWIVKNFDKLVVAGKILVGVLVALKVAQIAVNIAMMANPVGLVIAGVVALAASIYLVITRWEEFKKIMADRRDEPAFHLAKMHVPLLKSIDLLTFFSDRWNGIRRSFREGDTIIEKLEGIGKAAWSFLLKPIEAVLKVLSKLGPGFEDAYNSVKNIRGALDRGMMDETKVSTSAKLGYLQQYGFGTPEEMRKAGARARARRKMDRKSRMSGAFMPTTTGGFEGDASRMLGDDAGTAISAGGSKQTNVNITLQNLVNELNISGGDFDETTDDMKTKVQQALLQVLNSANTAALG